MGFIGDLLIFILSLSVLVVIHELGHLLTAKLFKVYCREFSIGMGPLIFKLKKANWETQFSIRAIPLGGFVSMVGEDAGDNDMAGGQLDPSKKDEKDLTEEDRIIMSLPKERRLDGIKRWQRAIVMAAGVTMNVILAFFLFLGQGATSQTYDNSFKSLNVYDQTGLMASNGYISGSDFVSGKVTYTITVDGKQETYEVKDDNIENQDDLYKLFSIPMELLPSSENDYITYEYTCINPETNKTYDVSFVRNAEKNDNYIDYTGYFYKGSMGVSFMMRDRTFMEVVSFAGKSTVEGAGLIFEGLGMIFTQGLEAVGGPIAMFEVSSLAVDMGISYFFYLWGIISINLAVMNFLPIPGLDGWHFLVLIFEGITKKEMPSNAKNIASTIGLILLFGLMIIVTIKDIIGLF